jgi:hypothetical protein
MNNVFQLSGMFRDLDVQEKRTYRRFLQNAELPNIQNEIEKVNNTLAKYGLELDSIGYLKDLDRRPSNVDGCNLFRLNRNWRTILPRMNFDPNSRFLTTILTEIETYDRAALSTRFDGTRRVAQNQYDIFAGQRKFPQGINPRVRDFLVPNVPTMTMDLGPVPLPDRYPRNEDRDNMRRSRPYYELYSEMAWNNIGRGDLFISEMPPITVSKMGHGIFEVPWTLLFETIIFEIMSPGDREKLFDFIRKASIYYYKTGTGDDEDGTDIEFDLTLPTNT